MTAFENKENGIINLALLTTEEAKCMRRTDTIQKRYVQSLRRLKGEPNYPDLSLMGWVAGMKNKLWGVWH